MSDVTSPASPSIVDPADPVTVGGDAQEPATNTPIARDDPSQVGAATPDDAAESTDTGPTSNSEMGGDRI